MNLIRKIITRENFKKNIRYFLLSVFIVLLDQITKMLVAENFSIRESLSIIDGFLKFTYVHNKGAAFSFGNMFHDSVRLVIFKILPVLVAIYIARMILNPKERQLMKWIYAMILGGAIGNVIDRIRLDYVVDFISVYHNEFSIMGIKINEWHFAIFNIADSAVSIAAFLMIFDYISGFLKKSSNDKVGVA